MRLRRDDSSFDLLDKMRCNQIGILNVLMAVFLLLTVTRCAQSSQLETRGHHTPSQFATAHLWTPPEDDTPRAPNPDRPPLAYPPPATKTTTTTTTVTETVTAARALHCPVTLTSPCAVDPLDTPAVRPSFTIAHLPTFDCRIMPTTQTVTHSLTRPGAVEMVLATVTQTSTPTLTTTVYTSCVPSCRRRHADAVTVTTTSALHTEYEVDVRCDTPPVVVADMLVLYTTLVVAVRDADTVTVTTTPYGPASRYTNTYYVDATATPVVVSRYTACQTAPPCAGYEAPTLTLTSVLPTTTSTDLICLDNWLFNQMTTTRTIFSCYNPFSVYACAADGACPLPNTVTETLLHGVSTVVVTARDACTWSPWVSALDDATSPPPPPPSPPSPPPATSTLDDTRLEGELLLMEITVLLEELTVNLTALFPKQRMKVGQYTELIDRLVRIRYSASLARLPPVVLSRLAWRQKQMILSLGRFVGDYDRMREDSNAFFDQLGLLVTYLESLPVDYRGN